ncbi:HAD superfamily hydrolase [Agrilactobacillus composti DSM 18527 = JCM 14202]|uniref:HAD superfamily hydrolase n=1 Tax=Agrilactobacillus composti DSM 18527 = JCM 14202 TaxID=1423734 RepID=X0PTG3_9LACO|nr:HAD family phosphatase [Agrilactobacillus composti]KRM36667.1 HAD superfamily hydrolase [Agrilactobacillus composti DSM 18527 = JCM 14202]GAF40576.1 putative phosphatase YieH [Agrilactobacillus composti DSM 18527 = JCM 14202]
MYKGIIFDMDGLMFNSERLYLQANLKAGVTMGIPVTEAEYQELVGASEVEAENFNKSHFKNTQQQAEFFALTEDYVLDLVQAGELQKQPGLDALLTYLTAGKIPSVIASSNNQRMVTAFLSYFGLQDYFQGIITREQVSASKPDPALFIKAQQVLDLPKSDLLILEDSFNGIKAAEAAGIDVVMIPDLLQPTATVQQQTKAILPDLAQVITLLP